MTPSRPVLLTHAAQGGQKGKVENMLVLQSDGDERRSQPGLDARTAAPVDINCYATQSGLGKWLTFETFFRAVLRSAERRRGRGEGRAAIAAAGFVWCGR